MTDRQIVRRTSDGKFMIFCPGCCCGHWFQTSGSPSWQFNGDMERPTVSPSLLVQWTRRMPDCAWCDAGLPRKRIEIGWVHEDPAAGECGLRGCAMNDAVPVDVICHSFITDGQIQFLADSTHRLAGQTVPLEPF